MTSRESPRARRKRYLLTFLCAVVVVAVGYVLVGSFLVAVG